MKKNKVIFIILTLLLFCVFSIIEYKHSKSYEVLCVNSPFEIVADFNKNQSQDEDETVSILESYQYIDRKKVIPEHLSEKYNLPTETLITLSYLTEKFVNDNLKDRYIEIKNENNQKIIYLNKTNFNEKLLESGYIFKDYKSTNPQNLNKTLNYIKKNNFVVYNAKSNKYHKPCCKYGLMAHNYVFLPRTQLPKGAKGCKFCYGNGKNNNLTKTTKGKNHSAKTVPITKVDGSIKLFITDYTTKLKPDRQGNTKVCNEIVNQINNAKSTIDIAIYGYNSVPRIENALKNALKRGVKIRMVYDVNSKGDNIYPNTSYLAKLIGNSTNDKARFVSDSASRYTNYIMHDKFYIFDDSTVITGSANLSFTDMSGFNSNNVLLIKSKAIANIYKQEFEQMYYGKFHFIKSKIPQKENLQIGNSIITICFSPKDSTIEKVIIPLINQAKRYIYIPAFIITDTKLITALIGAKQRGVDVKIILDAANAKNPYSKHRILRQHGIQVKTETFAGKLHSKTILIDDTYSVIGSMNFSKNGERNNDENTVVIKNSSITEFNREFFKYLWKKIDNYWLTHDANAEGTDSEGSCSDGIDNDYDGKTDMEDSGCLIKHR